MLNLNLKKTMKKYFIYLASAAMLLATSCAKEEVNTTGETELITVQLNPETKTALGAEGTTTWDADDKVSVTVGGEVVGTLSLVEGSTFSGEITAGLNGEATLNYPAGVTAIPEPQAAVNKSFADGAALLEGTTTVEKLRAGEGVELQNKTALLQFTVAQAGDVTFEVGTAKYTVTGCKTGETYYACVEPAANVSFVARIGGYLSKKASANVTFEANKIANLEALPAPVASTYKIMGLNGDWTTGLTLYKDVDCYVLKNVSITASTEFKFSQGSNWGRPITLALGKWAYTYDVDGNLKTTAGTYDIYVSAANDAVCLVKSGEAMPAYASANKQLHLMLEGDDNCGLYMWSPSGTGLDNWDAAWKNYYGKIKMKQNASTWTEYYAFVVPSVAVDKSCKFLFKWYGGQSCDYNKTIDTDLPFWRNGGNDGSYSFSSKIAIN